MSALKDSYRSTLRSLEDKVATQAEEELRSEDEARKAEEIKWAERKAKIRAAWALLKSDEFLKGDFNMPVELDGNSILFVNMDDGFVLHKLYVCPETDSWILDSGFCETDLGVSNEFCLAELGKALAQIEFEHPIYMKSQKDRLQY
jgi:hypothetical protein